VTVSNITINDYIEFTAPSNFNPLSFESIGLQIWIKNVMGGSQNITVRFFDVSNVAISNEAPFGFNKSLSGEWQLAGVNINSFTFTSENPSARKVRFRWSRGIIDHPGFYMDLVQLEGGIVPPISSQNVVLTNEVEGSGITGEPISVTITEKALSNRTELLAPLEDDILLIGKSSDNTLYKVKISNLLKAPVDPGVGPYADTAAMQADQANQFEKYIYEADGVFYKYNGTTTGVLETDYTAFGSGSGGGLLGAEPVEEKFTYTSPAAQDFVVAGTPNGRPEIFVNSAYLDWTFWTWNAGTKTASISGVTLPETSKVVIKYYSNLSGTAVGSVTGLGVNNTDPVNPVIGYQPATHRENNTVLFDNDYVTGINAAARSGNILFDFTGAQLGACTVMRHQTASAFTFPTEADLMFATADISTTVANYFMFVCVKTDSPRIVHVFHAIEGGV
jgi:hypothetical protein